MPDYGPLGGLVGTVGAIAAAGAAILLTWRGRARFEPSESDIPKAPERVAGVVTTVLVAVLWASSRAGIGSGVLAALAIALALVAVAALLAYATLTGSQTYSDDRRRRKIIGGFSLTPTARSEMRRQKLTTQQYFKAVDYDPDRVWPRGRRAIAKTTFTAVYLVLVISGSIALTAAALLVEAKGSGAPASSPTVSARTLRWVDSAAGGTVLDGSVLTPGKRVWLEELFPGPPPTGFQVVESVDRRWPSSVQAAIAGLRQPAFAPSVTGFRAVSDAAWALPAPIGGGARVFTFTDSSPDGVPSISGSITVGEAVIATSATPGCATANTEGGLSGDPGTTCIGFTVSVALDPTFDAQVVVPWGEGDLRLVNAVGTYFDGLANAVASDHPGATFDAQGALTEFRDANAKYLPDAPPDGWQFSVDPPTVDAAPGRPGIVRLQVVAPSPGAAVVAVRLVSRTTGVAVLSPLVPIEVLGNRVPTVEITDPKVDLVGIDRLSYTGFENSMWYADVALSATAFDPEDGQLTGAQLVWTTDRIDLQPVALGQGETLRARPYSTSCEGGAIHVITVTASDSSGGMTSAKRTVEVGQVC